MVGRFYFPYEAHIARATLEAERIPAWVYDEHQVQMRWFIAHALGGVRVAVRPDDAERAREILAEDRSALAEEATLSLPVSDADLTPCPRCARTETSSKRHLEPPTELQWLGMLVLFLLGTAAPERRHREEYRCNGCGHTWTGASERG